MEEIGSNMTLIRGESRDVIIDCGMLFPYEECFDINYLIPDFSSLDSSRLEAIIITHGHEDHIGALGHLLKEFPDLTVYATPFTLHLIRRKLEEFGVSLNYKLYQPGEELKLASLLCTPVHVNHSIPETCGIIIQTQDKHWGALYISDFKVDLGSTHEKPIDFKLINEKLKSCQHTAYFMDSTNVIYSGKTTSESELVQDLGSIIDRPEKRLFITLFASNVHRLNAIAEMGKKSGRKIVLMGRSLRSYLEAAQETGHLSMTSDEFHQPDQVKGHEGRMLIFLSGCQGDFLSALRRYSYGEDSSFKPTPEDLVVFSSKVIPGNEKKIARIYNKLTEFGATILTASDHLIHASGHPGKEDLRLLLKNFTPEHYFPIHGESYMLKKHVEFINAEYPEVKTHLIYNYHEVKFTKDGIKTELHTLLEPRLIHGKQLEIERTQISQRRKMATQGAVFITLHRTQGLLELSTVGLPLMANDLQDKLKEKLLKQFQKDLGGREAHYVKDQLKISARQFYNNFLGYKPVTEVHLI